MKRTPLRRGAPLRRGVGIRAFRSTKRRRRPPINDYVRWVWCQPCCARDIATTPCYERVEADHAGRRGYGQKASHDTCIPLCRNHHRERGTFSGTFKMWDQAMMRAWLERMVARHQSAYRSLFPLKRI
jgi:hypothetical protein